MRSVPFFLLICTILLSSCSTHYDDSADLLYSPLPVVDPQDKALEEAVASFLGGTEAPVASTYEFTRIDLDSDGRRDGLVMLKTPYGYWCGIHGCAMLVFKAQDQSFEFVNAIQPIRAPLYISNTETNGWKNLVARVSGRWDKAKDVLLQYDGQQYADNPSHLPEYLRLASNEEYRVFAD